jgi:hypothetical protein
VGTRKRFRIVRVAATFGVIALILAVLIGAFVAVDQRALQAFKAGPPTAQAEKNKTAASDSDRMIVSGGGSAPSPSAPASTGALPALTKTETVGSAAASPPASSPTTLVQQTIPAETEPVSDPILRTHTPHGSKKHGKRFARGARNHDIFSAFFRPLLP